MMNRSQIPLFIPLTFYLFLPILFPITPLNSENSEISQPQGEMNERDEIIKKGAIQSENQDKNQDKNQNKNQNKNKEMPKREPAPPAKDPNQFSVFQEKKPEGPPDGFKEDKPAKKTGVEKALQIPAGYEPVVEAFKNFNESNDNSLFFNRISRSTASMEFTSEQRLEMIIFFDKMVQTFWEDSKFESAKSLVHFNLGIGLMNLNYFEKAEFYFKKSWEGAHADSVDLRCGTQIFLSRIADLKGQFFQAHSYALSALQLSEKAKKPALRATAEVLEMATRFHGDNNPINFDQMNAILPSVKFLLDEARGPHPDVMTLIRSLLLNKMPQKAQVLIDTIQPLIPSDSKGNPAYDQLHFLEIECWIDLGKGDKAKLAIGEVMKKAAEQRDEEKFEFARSLKVKLDMKNNVPMEKILEESEKIYQQFPEYHERMAIQYYQQCEDLYRNILNTTGNPFGPLKTLLAKGMTHLKKSEMGALLKHLPLKFLRNYSVWHRLQIEILVREGKSSEGLETYFQWQRENLMASAKEAGIPIDPNSWLAPEKGSAHSTTQRIKSGLKKGEAWVSWLRGIKYFLMLKITPEESSIELVEPKENLYHDIAKLAELLKKGTPLPAKLTSKILEPLIKDLDKLEGIDKVFIYPNAGLHLLPLNSLQEHLSKPKILKYVTLLTDPKTFSREEEKPVSPDSVENIRRYLFQDPDHQHYNHFFLQSPELTSFNPMKSKYFSSQNTFMDGKNLVESRFVPNKKGKGDANSIQFKEMVVLLPQYDDPLHDSDGQEWNQFFLILKNLGFKKARVIFQMEKDFNLSFDDQNLKLKKVYPFGFDCLF